MPSSTSTPPSRAKATSDISLPAMRPGNYALYGDVVHASGFPETLVSNIVVPAKMPGGVPGPDDAAASPPPLSGGMLGNSYKLPDGYVMVWDRPSEVTANSAYTFRFHLLNDSGNARSRYATVHGHGGSCSLRQNGRHGLCAHSSRGVGSHGCADARQRRGHPPNMPG